MRSRFFALILFAVVGLPGFARADGLPDPFTLGRYVPADGWLYIHAVHNPERVWIDEKWDKISSALKTSGIDHDVANLVYSFLSATQKKDVEQAVEKTMTLLKGVRWGDLVQKEFVFVERLATAGTDLHGINFDYFVLTRGASESAETNAAGLVAILKEIATLDPSLSVVDAKRGDVMTWSLAVKKKSAAESAKPESMMTILRFQDVIGIVVSPPIGPSHTTDALDEVVAFMNKESKKTPIIASPRFKDAVAQVKPPTGEFVYFDFQSFIGCMGRLFTAVAKEEKGDAEDRQAMGAIAKIIELVDVVDYTMVSTQTKGRQEFSDAVVRFQPGKEKSPIAQMILQRKPFDPFDQFIPADATGFHIDGGIDLERLYTAALEFVEQSIPDGKGLIEKWKAKLTEVDFDPQRDIFSWWSGEMISMDLPAAVVTPMGNSDSVVMIRVKDSELATRKVNGAIDFVSAAMQGEGQALLISPADVQGQPFRQISHPMFAMFLRPVIGVKGDWLIIATSTGAVTKCLDVAAGKAGSVSKNERFTREGLVPKGPVRAISFRDTSQFGNELAGAAAMVQMVGGMATMGMGKEVPPEAKTAMKSVLDIVGKLGPILQKIDFYSSEASISTYDGERTLRTQSVVTYKPSDAGEAKTANAAEPIK